MAILSDLNPNNFWLNFWWVDSQFKIIRRGQLVHLSRPLMLLILSYLILSYLILSYLILYLTYLRLNFWWVDSQFKIIRRGQVVHLSRPLMPPTPAGVG